MTDNNNIDFKSISTLRKVITVTLLILFTFWGIFAGGMSISKLHNYTHPFIFGLLSATFGLLVGISTAKKFKSIFAVTKKLHSDYVGGIFILCIGFIGSFMLLGHYLNQSISTIDKCDNYPIVDKYEFSGGRRGDIRIELYVVINGIKKKINCNKFYYDKVEIGDEINICIYSSLLGFDFYKLTDEEEIIF